MDKLTKEEVLHVAKLARLKLNEDEIESYSIKLKGILNEIEKINDIDIDEETPIMISSVEDECKLRDKNLETNEYKDEMLKNAPSTYLNYVEVRGVFND